MKVYIKNISRKEGEFQFYKHQLVEACIRQNIPFVNELQVCVRLKLSMLMTKLGHWINFFFCRCNNKAIIVPTGGGRINICVISVWFIL